MSENGKREVCVPGDVVTYEIDRTDRRVYIYRRSQRCGDAGSMSFERLQAEDWAEGLSAEAFAAYSVARDQLLDEGLVEET